MRNIILFCLISCAGILNGQTTTWDGTVNSWNNPLRWSSGLPGTGTTAIINGGTPIINSGFIANCGTLQINGGTIRLIGTLRVHRDFENNKTGTDKRNVFEDVNLIKLTNHLNFNSFNGSKREDFGMLEFRRLTNGTNLIKGETNFPNVKIIGGSDLRIFEIATSAKAHVYFGLELISGILKTSGSNDPRLILKSNINGIIRETAFLKDNINTKLHPTDNLIIAERYCGDTFLGYHYFTPIVKQQRTVDLSNNSSNTFNNTYPWSYTPYSSAIVCDPATPFVSVSYYDETVTNISDNGQYGWTGANPSADLTVGTGYYGRFLTNSSTSEDSKKIIWGDVSGRRGTVLNDLVNIPITYTLSPNSSGYPYDGGNLIGNPYPSPINWNNWAYENPNIASTIAIWEPELNNPTQCQFKGDYYYYDLSTATGTNGWNGIVAAGQAFFIVTSASGDFPFTNDLRYYPAVSTENPIFFKMGAFDVNKLSLKLNAEEGETEVVLFFDEKGSSQYKKDLDVRRFTPNEGTISCYSIKENNELIMGRYENNNQTIPLLIKTLNPGNVEIRISDLIKVDYDLSYYFEDRQLGKYQKIDSDFKYNFNMTNFESKGRFFIHSRIGESIKSQLKQDGTICYLQNNNIVVEKNGNQLLNNSNIEIVNINGQIVFSTIWNTSNSTITIPTDYLNSGIYFVRILSDLKSEIHRVSLTH